MSVTVQWSAMGKYVRDAKGCEGMQRGVKG